jgi:branched-chain amino acid transport system permease protein
VIDYVVAMGTLWGFYALLALGLNLQWGMSGLVNFGLVAFFAVGAYTSALVTLAGASFPIGVAAAACLAAVLGLIVALSTVRLREDYLAVVTLGAAEIVRLVVLNEVWLTEGARGLPGIPRPLEMHVTTGYGLFYLALVVLAVAVSFVLAEAIRRSPFGRVLRSIREDADVTAVAGKNVLAFKLQAFVLGAGIAGVAGSLYAHYLTFLSPDQFDPTVTIYVWIAVIVGGSGNNRGVLMGALILMGLLEGTRFLKDLVPAISGVRLAALRLMFVGVLLIVFMMFRPEGLWKEEKQSPA